MSLLSIELTTPLVNKCFRVGVASEAMDGAAPELNLGWVHRRINTYPEVRHTLFFQYFTSIYRADRLHCRQVLRGSLLEFGVWSLEFFV